MWQYQSWVYCLCFLPCSKLNLFGRVLQTYQFVQVKNPKVGHLHLSQNSLLLFVQVSLINYLPNSQSYPRNQLYGKKYHKEVLMQILSQASQRLGLLGIQESSY